MTPLEIAANRRRAERWREHDAAVPYCDERPRCPAMSDVAPTTDTTGKPARHDGALRGRRVSWQEFPGLAPTRAAASTATMVEFAPAQFCAEGVARPMAGGRRYERTEQGGSDLAWTIPPGARLRAAQPPRRVEPRQVDVFWLGRLARFPERYTDPTRDNRGNPRRSRAMAAGMPMSELLRPLSATDTARTAIAHIAAAVRPVRTAPMRLPMAEEHQQCRLSARHVNAADWFQSELEAQATAKAEGTRRRTPSGGMSAYGNRDPLALWPAEAAADTAIRVRHRFRSLGGLARIVVKALEGAEMRSLAPAWPIPQRNLAEAGRIRLRAGLELCARMAERETDRLPLWETLEVARAACTECATLEAKRKLRVAANDNVPMRIAA